MSLKGAPALHDGLRYEEVVMISLVLDLLEEKATELVYESVDPSLEKFEATSTRVDKTVEYHQVKRQRTGSRWTINSLESVLVEAFRTLERDPCGRFVFTSTQDVGDIRLLGEDANRTENFDQFDKFVLPKGGRRAKFEKLLGVAQTSPELLYDLLKQRRLRIVPLGEDIAREHNQTRLSYLVSGDRRLAEGLIRDLLENRLGQRIVRADVWAWLARHGFGPRRLPDDPNLLPTLDCIVEAFRQHYSAATILGEVIPRSEAEEVAVECESPGASVFITGVGGAGKSQTVLQVLDLLTKNGFTCLPLRVDKFPADTLEVTQLLREFTSRPISPLEFVTAAAARDHGSSNARPVLLVDQLDHASSLSGERPQCFELVRAIVEGRTNSYQDVRCITVCREFDLRNEVNLAGLLKRQKNATSVVVGPLALEEVVRVVEELGVAADSLTAEQLELLAIPVHLKMFEDIADDAEHGDFSAQTQDAFFGYYWRTMDQRFRSKYLREWDVIIRRILDAMESSKLEIVHADQMVGAKSELEWLASNNVLVALSNDEFEFFHPAFLDYAIPRTLLDRHSSLFAYLVSGKQDLRRRIQVRRAVQFLRSAGGTLHMKRYLENVEEVLHKPDIRPIIKSAVLSAIKEQQLASEETELLERLVVSSDPESEENGFISREASSVLSSPNGLVTLLDREVLGVWLADSSHPLHLVAIRSLGSGLSLGIEVDRCVDVLQELLQAPGSTKTVRRVLRFCRVGSNRRVFELALRAYEPNDDREDLPSLFYQLDRDKPKWALELTGTVLSKNLRNALKTTPTPPYRWRALEEWAKRAVELPIKGPELSNLVSEFPDEFLRAVVEPLVIAIFLFGDRQRKPFKSLIWSTFIDGSRFYDPAEYIIQAAAQSLQACSNETREWAIEHFQRVADYEAGSYLLMHAVDRNSASSIQTGLNFLEERLSRRESLASLDGLRSAQHLVSELSGSLGERDWEALELKIVRHVPTSAVDRAKRSSSPNRSYEIRREALVLLESAKSRLSKSANRELAALRRAHPVAEDSAFVVGRLIRSSTGHIGDAEMGLRIDDENWLKRLAHLDSELSDSHDDIRAAEDVLSDLHEAARVEPQRFARLILGAFPDRLSATHARRILSGILRAFQALVKPGATEESEPQQSLLPASLVEALVHKCAEFPDPRLVRECSMLVEKAAIVDSPTVIDTLLSWAADLADADLIERAAELRDSENPPERLTSLVLNSPRCVAIGTLAHVLDRKRELGDDSTFQRIRSDLRGLALNDLAPIRAAAMQPLTTSLNWDADFAREACLRSLEVGADRDLVLSARTTQSFVGWALGTDPDFDQQVLTWMVHSKFEIVQRIGANFANALALITGNDDEVQVLANWCASDDAESSHRFGVLDAARNRISKNPTESVALLVARLNDDDSEIRTEAVQILTFTEPQLLEDNPKLLSAYARSKAFGIRIRQVLDLLVDNAPFLDDHVEPIVGRFLRDPELRTKSHVRDLIPRLLVRIAQKRDEDTAILDLLDNAVRAGMWTVELEEALESN